MNQPDLIILLTDEERAAPSYESPSLQAWRRDHLPARRWFTDNGVSFQRHYVAATACVPSRPSLLTGQYPDLHGVTQTDGLGKAFSDSRMRWLREGEVPTIGNWFRAAGYDTYYDGKWHISHADLMVNGKPLATNTNDGHVIPDAVQAYLDADPLDGFGFSGWVGPEPHGGIAANSGYVRDPLIADRVVAWLEDRYARRAAGDTAAQRPFLLICSFVNPHDIVLFPLYMRRGRPFPDSVAPPPAIGPSPTDNEDLTSKPALQMAYRDSYYSGYSVGPVVRRSYQRNASEYRALYHRFHHDVDGPLDRVRRAVTDHADDAVLVLSSDHGDLLGSHGGLHQKWYQMYDEAVRVPFVVARVGQQTTEPSVVDRTPTSHVDLLPTLLGFAGLNETELASELRRTHSEVHPLPGRDLSNMINDRSAPPVDGSVYLITRDNMLEGDGSASAMARAAGRMEPAFPMQIKVPQYVGTNVEAVVTTIDGRLFKLVRTFDDPATWSEPHVRQLAARRPLGPVYRSEVIPDQWELYDLDADPIEAVNLATDRSLASTVELLVAELDRVRAASVPARNQPWEYATRPERIGPRRKRPPRPARAARRLLQRLGLHPDDDQPTSFDVTGRRALVVATNHDKLGSGKDTGVFASELTVPYYAFVDAGMTVDVASPLGGVIPVDPSSLRPVIRTSDDDRYLADGDLKARLTNSLAIAEVDISVYDIVFLAGGWGAAWDLGTSEPLADQVSLAAAQGTVLGGVCHGPLGLAAAKTPEGRPLVEGRRLTAVTDKQVRELRITDTPQHPESVLRAAGAVFESSSRRRDMFANHVVVDGDLITGQNQNAGPMVAREMMRRLAEKQAAASH